MILNLTQHKATKQQEDAGVVNVNVKDMRMLRDLLTFDEIPTHDEMCLRAIMIADIASNNLATAGDTVMIGGANFFMGHVEEALTDRHLNPVYAFSTRDVVEVQGDDGEVTKTAVFLHKGFVPCSITQYQSEQD